MVDRPDRSYRVLVTGASGFIGKALVSALVAQGHHVRAASRGGYVSGTDLEAVELPDLERPVDWSGLVDGIDVVVHLAGIAHRQVANPHLDQANRGATADLARSCAAAGVRRLIFISSIGAQTGTANDHVLTEADRVAPTADYGRTKLKAEEAIRAAGVPYTIFRPTIVYGPNPVANVRLLLRMARLRVPLPFGAFQNQRSLLAIDNLISAIVASLDSPQMENETFVISDPEPISLRKMFTILRQADGRSAQLISVPPMLLRLALFASGRLHLWDRFATTLVVSPRKLLDAGWRPTVTTEEGLAAMARGTRH